MLHGLMQLQFHELPVYYAAVRRCIQVLEEADLASTGQSANLLYQLVPAMNSISMSCQAVGYVPWTLIDYAESKGMRIKQPVGNSHDELSSSQARDQSHAASSSSSKRDGSRKHGGGHKGHANNNSGHHHPQVNGHHRPAGSDMHQQQGAASLRVNGVNGHSRGTMVAEQDAHFPAQPTSDLPLFAQQAVHERQLEVNGKVLNLPGPIELDSFPAADHASSIKQ